MSGTPWRREISDSAAAMQACGYPARCVALLAALRPLSSDERCLRQQAGCPP